MTKLAVSRFLKVSEKALDAIMVVGNKPLDDIRGIRGTVNVLSDQEHHNLIAYFVRWKCLDNFQSVVFWSIMTITLLLVNVFFVDMYSKIVFAMIALLMACLFILVFRRRIDGLHRGVRIAIAFQDTKDSVIWMINELRWIGVDVELRSYADFYLERIYCALNELHDTNDEREFKMELNSLDDLIEQYPKWLHSLPDVKKKLVYKLRSHME